MSCYVTRGSLCRSVSTAGAIQVPSAVKLHAYSSSSYNIVSQILRPFEIAIRQETGLQIHNMDPRRAEDKLSTSGPSSRRAPGSPTSTSPARTKKGHRWGIMKNSRRKSSAVSIDDTADGTTSEGPGNAQDNFYLHGWNLSNTSIDGDSLPDHMYII